MKINSNEWKKVHRSNVYKHQSYRYFQGISFFSKTMAGSRAAIWAPVLVVGILIIAGLVIATAVVLSLIPLYINNRAVDSSAATELGLFEREE